jgi:hypothetical protein
MKGPVNCEQKKIDRRLRSWLWKASKEVSVSERRLWEPDGAAQEESRPRCCVASGRASGGLPISRGALYELLQNRIYLGEITHKGVSYPGKQPAIIDQKLWDRVQDQLKANLQAPMRRPRVTEQSLLMGLLYDDKGNRFIPSHTNKKGQRYRYYVSQAVIKNPGKGSAGPARIPAKEIEDLVVSQLTSLLQSPQKLLDLLGTEQTEQIVTAAREWVNASMEKVHAVLKSTVTRVVVRQHNVQILLSKQALRDALLGPQDIDSPIEQGSRR